MDSFSQCLDAVKEYCRQHITEAAYNLWIKGLEAESFSGDSAVLSTSSEFLRSNVESRYLNLLKEGFEAVIGYLYLTKNHDRLDEVIAKVISDAGL